MKLLARLGRWVFVQLVTLGFLFIIGSALVDVVHGQSDRNVELEHRVTRLETLYEANTQMLRLISGGMVSLLGHAFFQLLRMRKGGQV